MTQPQSHESTNNHSETEPLSFVKRGKLWLPETVQRSLFQKRWNWTGFKGKKLWDFVQLLMPLIIVVIGTISFQWMMKERDLQIADDRAKQEILTNYFDQISTLLFEQKLRTAKEGSEAQIVSRARTLIALQELDGWRKGQLVKFLVEAKLVEAKKPIIGLIGADLYKANLHGANLHGADLHGADLSFTDLREVNLSKANLYGANLFMADLSKADLHGVNLRETDLSIANLSFTDLHKAKLSKANLHVASLQGASLKSSSLKDALLCKTIMPEVTVSVRDCTKVKQLEKNQSK